ncbi:hypothetical protein FisN_1Hh227 [Fistulifera solaris]|uniref:Nucleotide exchange factor Fes1 domain-containing protein n=1 Tax=Fistulifera solaris TaxID=1519565 RepID=A0A1Z5JEB9_FISSO|nr:hypothetical protein FisN_1Hh227 [Fistulifera solaris]|eukprot:GAX12296.1 hypothetical protein FisN_1Hh227 [Fistulifera solaris]
MSSTSNDPWAWLGLLKWSLAYSDGTSPSATNPLSDSDREFLEKVMKEGIINEGDRMRTILEEVTTQFQKWKDTKSYTQEEDDQVSDLLQELRDIVEQIDYATAFCSLQGLPFLLGCAQETECIPRSSRLISLGILATLCQNNPEVQKQLLERGALQLLSDLFFATTDDGELRSRILQAISANVRSYDLAEAVFDQLEQSVTLLQEGLSDPSTVSRALFMLRALLTSDSTSRFRMTRFQPCVLYAVDNFCGESSDVHLREMTLELVQQILLQKVSVNAVLSRKNSLVATGVARVSELRKLASDESAGELSLWEEVIQLLARAQPDLVNNDVVETTRTEVPPQ